MQRYGKISDSPDREISGTNSLIENSTGGGKAEEGHDSPARPPPPPEAPPPLLKANTGFVVVNGPPTRELLQQLARLGIRFDHIIHLTNNPRDVVEAEASGATQYAFSDSELIFEDASENSDPDIDDVEKELEKQIDEELTLDIDIEPSESGTNIASQKATTILSPKTWLRITSNGTELPASRKQELETGTMFSPPSFVH